MATTKEDIKGFSVLKDHVYSLSVAGKQADGYTKTTKAIAEYVGRVYSHDMKQLVLNGTESVPVERDYPEGVGTKPFGASGKITSFGKKRNTTTIKRMGIWRQRCWRKRIRPTKGTLRA